MLSKCHGIGYEVIDEKMQCIARVPGKFSIKLLRIQEHFILVVYPRSPKGTPMGQQMGLTKGRHAPSSGWQHE